MDNNAQLYYKGAKKLGLKVIYHQDMRCIEIPLGGRHYHILIAFTPLNKGASVFVSKNKFIANQLLAYGGFPVPKAIAFNKEDFSRLSLEELIKSLNFPLVAKPMENSGRGENVLCNIKDLSTLEEQIRIIFKEHDFVQVEEFHTGMKEYRVTALKNRVIGVVERFPASVCGDGEHTIEELIIINNEERASLSAHLTISPLVYDLEYKQALEEQGLSLKSVPAKGEKIQLCHTVNTGRGGNIYSHGKKIHRKNKTLICRALRELGLDYGGLDVLCEDINLPFEKTKWMIIEINNSPDTTIHEIPNQGIKAEVIRQVLLQIIWRHPFSYLYHLRAQSVWSRLLKALSCVFLMYWVLHHI